MGRTITVEIDTDDLCEMLQDRVRYWTDDSEVLELFDEYYEHATFNGYFDGATLDVMSIVDNDYVNNFSILTRSEFEEAREKHIKEQMEEDGFNEECSKEELEQAREEYEEDTPTWEDVECGENDLDFIEGSYFEAKTDSCILISW